MFAKQFYWSKLSWAFFQTWAFQAFQLSPDRFPFSYWAHLDWLALGGLMGVRNLTISGENETYVRAACHGVSPGSLTFLPVFVSMEGPIMGLLYHLWGQSDIEI